MRTFLAKDDIWGGLDVTTGKVVGLPSFLKNGLVDLLPTTYGLNPERLQVIDFIMPHQNSKMVVIISSKKLLVFCCAHLQK